MTEENVTTSGTSTTDEKKASPAPLTSFIGEQGELKEGWQGIFLPEDLRSQPIYSQIKDIKGAFSIIGNQAKLVGKKGIIPPTEISPQSEWDAYYDAAGRPKTAGDYNLPIPKEFEDYYDEGMIKQGREIFHKIGLNQKQADALWEFEKARVALMDKTITESEALEKSQAETALRQKWGTAYDENKHIADRVVSENVPPDKMDAFLAQYGNDPLIAEVLSIVGRKFLEHRIITDITTPVAAANKKIDELMGKDLPVAQQKALPYWDRNHPNHQATVDMVQNLMKEQASRR